MMIFAACLTIFAAVTFYQLLDPATDASRDTLFVSQARSACDAIADAINTVYSNGAGATRTVGIQLSNAWDLQLDNSENVLRICFENIRLEDKNVDNVESDLVYAFDNSLLNLSAGSYTVIVEWSSSQGITRIGDKIYIHINPVAR
jgi:type 1 fimbria pilin